MTVDKELREKLRALGQKVLCEVSPERCITRYLRREGTVLYAGLSSFDLARFRRVLVVGFGKAASGMAQALEKILGDFLDGGMVIVGSSSSAETKRIRVVNASHPIPDERTVSASHELLELARTAGPQDFLIVLISGGGSALFEIPARGLSLEDLQCTTDLLLRCGATIREMNVVRKHLSAVKGGLLLHQTQAGAILAVILSDIPGDDVGTVASGPVSADPSTFAEARAILERYGAWDFLPASIRAYIHRGEHGLVPETVKPSDPSLAKVAHLVVGSGKLAAEVAQEFGIQMGFHTQILTTTMQGEAREIGKFLGSIAAEEVRFARPLPSPALFILAGETTVTVRGAGKGGRNQELALAFALAVEGLAGVALLALATDGQDGCTDAAGGIVDGGTAGRIKAAGIDPHRALSANDSYTALSVSGDLLLLGPTGTNVADLVLLGVERRGA
ncbi:MAG: glycerate kinase [Candidatus Bipolaricaulota bacterium]|nr:glycerate kinase [Candidatus Bipolaricaulota bacterium]MDW8126309.1 glycerate kinase [Candidatus Bipolaricaulota bacterium]